MRLKRSLPSKRAGLRTSVCLLTAALLLAPLTSAQGEETIAGGQASSTADGGEPGMPASNTRVKSILADHPGDLVTICVAGCDGKPSVVQVLPKPSERRIGAMRTTAGVGPANQRPPYGVTVSDDAVTCVAGCDGMPGQVLQRFPGLPPPKTAVRPSERGRDEPLDAR